MTNLQKGSMMIVRCSHKIFWPIDMSVGENVLQIDLICGDVRLQIDEMVVRRLQELERQLPLSFLNIT